MAINKGGLRNQMRQPREPSLSALEQRQRGADVQGDQYSTAGKR